MKRTFVVLKTGDGYDSAAVVTADFTDDSRAAFKDALSQAVDRWFAGRDDGEGPCSRTRKSFCLSDVVDWLTDEGLVAALADNGIHNMSIACYGSDTGGCSWSLYEPLVDEGV